MPSFVAQSVKSMVNVTALPSTSAAVIIFAALQEVALPVTTAEIPPKVTVGVCIGSKEVKVSVTVSPVVALDGSVLSDAMDTVSSSGAVLSTVTSGLSAVGLVIILPSFVARSE